MLTLRQGGGGISPFFVAATAVVVGYGKKIENGSELLLHLSVTVGTPLLSSFVCSTDSYGKGV
jgi:hypothetical protein